MTLSSIHHPHVLAAGCRTAGSGTATGGCPRWIFSVAIELTLLVSTDGHTAWSSAAEGLPMSLVLLGDSDQDVFHTGVAGADPDALVVRPMATSPPRCDSDRHGAASLRQALQVVNAPSPVLAKAEAHE